MNKTYHIWYYGQPQPDAPPFTTPRAAKVELDRQLNEAATHGEYMAAQIVEFFGSTKQYRLVTPEEMRAA